jgi:catechol 2,3-dioxygenase-like lactoylglutathione lyase family enzyme
MLQPIGASVTTRDVGSLALATDSPISRECAMEAIGWIGTVALECPDPAALAHFYSRLTGRPVVFAGPDWYSLADDSGGVSLSFQLAPGHQPPVWPDPASSMQFHLHVKVGGDLDAAERAVVAIGATRFAEQPSPQDFRVLADPAGHPFCLVPASRPTPPN